MPVEVFIWWHVCLMIDNSFDTSGPTEPQDGINVNNVYRDRQRQVCILFRRFPNLFGRLHPLRPCSILVSLCHADRKEKEKLLLEIPIIILLLWNTITTRLLVHMMQHGVFSFFPLGRCLVLCFIQYMHAWRVASW